MMADKKEYNKYKCACGWRTKRVYTGWRPTITCGKCGGVAHVQLDIPRAPYDPNRRRIPMTDQQKRLVGWHYNEKSWIRDIESRRVVPPSYQQKLGAKVIRVPPGKAAPWERG